VAGGVSGPDVEPEEVEEDAWPLFATAPGTLVVGTASYFPPSPLIVEVWPKPPPLQLEAWDHVAEASLDVPAGEIQIGFDSYASLAVAPGSYRVRVRGANLEEANPELSGSDRYQLQIWPAPEAGPVVHKCWRRLPPNATE
jgi:hypothetical protein